MSVRASWRVLVVLLCASVLAVPRARADAAEPGAAQHRLEQSLSAELHASLSAEASRAFTWRVTWTAINGAVAVASFGGVFVLPRSQQPSLIIGGIAALFSSAFTWFLPLEVEADAELSHQLSNLPEDQRRARLEELYAHSAQDESDRIQWPWHVVSVLTALIPAAIIWLGYDQPQEAAISLLTGLALGELALLTQPTGLTDRTESTRGQLRVAFTGRAGLVSYAVAW